MRVYSHRLLTLVIKEFLSYVRDPRTRLILIGPPLVQLLVFSFAATLEVDNINIAIMDRDAGSHGDALVERVTAASFIDEVTLVTRARDLERLIDNRSVLLALSIPSSFSRNLERGDTAPVQVILDGRRANAAQVANGYLSMIASAYGAQLDSERLPALQGPTTRHWFNPNLNYQWFIVPSLSGVLALLIAMMITALSIARERELGTFDQLLVSPLSSGQIIMGKSIPALIIGALLGMIMILAGVSLFGIPFTGSALMLSLVLAVFILSGVGIGLAVSAISQTQQQAILGAFAIIIPVVLTSGFATPVQNMPEWLQLVSVVNPLRWYLVIVQGTFLKALPATLVVMNAAPLLVIAMLTLGFATWFVRGRLE